MLQFFTYFLFHGRCILCLTKVVYVNNTHLLACVLLQRFGLPMLSHRKSIREELLTGSEELLTGSEELLIDCGKLQYSSRNLQALFSKIAKVIRKFAIK